ncbi:hypothetical protein AB3G45_14040 [Shinella sp. S4-D37]|uniref:hypothetical protein n=1 Tax=Shinella sp. S4-D37 TaxID=3161999 RepID=UPI003467D01E
MRIAALFARAGEVSILLQDIEYKYFYRFLHSSFDQALFPEMKIFAAELTRRLSLRTIVAAQ